MLEQQKIDMYVMTHHKYFPEDKIFILKDKLSTIDEEKFNFIATIDLKDPTVLLIISILLGSLGIDRFMIGDTLMGVFKLLTAGGCGIFYIIDFFLISKKTKEVNFNKIMSLL